MMQDKITRFIKSAEFRRRIPLLETFQNEEELIRLLFNYNRGVHVAGQAALNAAIDELYPISNRYIENAGFKNRFYIRLAILIFCRFREGGNEIGKAEYENALNIFKELEFLEKIDNLHEALFDIQRQQKYIFRYMFGNTEVGFKILKMNVPKEGDLIEIDYEEEDEILEFLKDLFGIENLKIINYRTQLFKFKVVSVIARISNDYDLNDNVEYIVNVIPSNWENPPRT